MTEEWRVGGGGDYIGSIAFTVHHQSHHYMSRTSITSARLSRTTPRHTLQLRTMVNVPLFGMKERQPTADEKALIDDVVQLCMSSISSHQDVSS
jgi:hypothetical protein